ncbi:hypothetical protein BaRGS_00025585 [Batillaria attramentaria]|uniref:Uncharacterized protein n=1 Tax=Batillaria attramentaria TaxID=370345 RepID=A0ABD0K7X3_9CAEN
MWLKRTSRVRYSSRQDHHNKHASSVILCTLQELVIAGGEWTSGQASGQYTDTSPQARMVMHATSVSAPERVHSLRSHDPRISIRVGSSQLTQSTGNREGSGRPREE